MGRVYLARQDYFDRDVALKVVQQQFASDQDFAERFRSEMRLAGSLDHPAIVPVYEAGEQDGQLYIAMKLVDGENLSQRISRAGRLSPEEATKVVADIAGALDEAHSKRILHRDVKPANILLGHGSDRAYLTDFGIAKSLEATQSLTDTGFGVGAIRYMSPEQVENRNLDERSDIYSLGCVLLEALTGVDQYADESMASILLKKVSQAPPRPSELAPNLGDSFDSVLARALAKDPDDRYESAGELAAAARKALSGADETVVLWSKHLPQDREPTKQLPVNRATRSGSRRQTASLGQSPPGKNRLPWLITAAMSVVVLVLAGYALSQGSGGSSEQTTRDVVSFPNESESNTAESESTSEAGQPESVSTVPESNSDSDSVVDSQAAPAATSYETTTVSREYFQAEVPLGWIPEEVDKDNSGRLTNRWVNPSDERVFVLIDSQVPAPVESPVESAASVRESVAEGDGYSEQSFYEASLDGWPAAVWVFDDGDERKIDIFKNQCNVGLAILGSAPPDAFWFYRPAFVNVAKSIDVPCE